MALGDFELSFNLIQQGANDQYSLPLEELEEGVYTGSFKIKQSDGIFNKDGLAAITVNIPNPCSQSQKLPCGSDDIDPFNRGDLHRVRDTNVSYETEVEDVSPETVKQQYLDSRTQVAVDKVALKQPYDKDDPSFSFGNPELFKR